MPQLGPMNWLFVYMFFWIIVLVFCIVMWWEFDVCFEISSCSLGDGEVKLTENLNWMW
uniref:ATP synthase F0 subunit 8 n=1 Tax=Neolepetopsis sp. TaxID=3071115 RepID=A0AA96HRM9_9GAST|nr:ATP synthase F0 subunit 8 [Neolepetopsis sp.]